MTLHTTRDSTHGSEATSFKSNMTDFFESYISKSGELWSKYIRNSINSYNVDSSIIRQAKLSFIKQYLTLFQQEDKTDLIKDNDKYLLKHFDALVGLYLKAELKNIIVPKLANVDRMWQAALQTANETHKKVSLNNVTLEDLVNACEEPLAKRQCMILPKNAGVSVAYNRCQNFLTRGGYHKVVHKSKNVANSKYQILKAAEIEKYFGDKTSAFLVEVYFKRCTNSQVQMYDSRFLVENYEMLGLPTIGLSRSYFSTELNQKLVNRVLVPCVICFTIGVEEACGQSVGHSLKESRNAILYGFSYALECARSRLFGEGSRSNSLHQSGGLYQWHTEKDPNKLCGTKTWFCCQDCNERWGTKRNRREKKHDAFHEFKHLSESYGVRKTIGDALCTLCNVRKDSNYSDGEHVSGVWLTETEGAVLKVSLGGINKVKNIQIEKVDNFVITSSEVLI